MEADVRKKVRERAGDRCEYCRLPQNASEATFHIEHIVALQHGILRSDDVENLALACNRCNLHKGTNLATIDLETNTIVPIFHPRHDSWEEHFRLSGARIVGLTAIGRATARLLQMNAQHRVELREILLRDGQF